MSYATLADERGALRSARDVREIASKSTIIRPKLLNRKNMHTAGIDRFGVPMRNALLYTADLFHTLLNMPRYRFVTIFILAYVLAYVLFALLYVWQPDECIPGVQSFAAALWFSVQTSATIGYGAPLVPSPSCVWINLVIMVQTIFSSGLDYCLMGLVFARFSAPSKRSLSVRFSECAVVHRHASGYWCLCFRLANMRKHLMLKPKVQVLLAVPDHPGQSCFVFEELELEGWTSAMANLKLGLAVTITHVVRPSSPLWGLSVADLEERDMEVAVFLDGIDAMTSNSTMARHSFFPSDIRMNERFATLYMQNRKGKLGLDFSEFDRTVPAAVAAGSALSTGADGRDAGEIGVRHSPSPPRGGRHTPPPPGAALPALSAAVLWGTPFSELTQRSATPPPPSPPGKHLQRGAGGGGVPGTPVVSVHALMEQLDRISPIGMHGEPALLVGSAAVPAQAAPGALELQELPAASTPQGGGGSLQRAPSPAPAALSVSSMGQQTSALLTALLADASLREPLRRQVQELQQQLTGSSV